MTGKVHFAMTSTGSSQIIFSGKLRGLETSLNSTSCDTTAHANSCGVHIHAGKSCAERGPHFFAGTTDIWTDVQYTSTNAKGKAKFTRILKKGVNTDIDGRVFVVHNAAAGQMGTAAYVNVNSSGGFLASGQRAGNSTYADTSTNLSIVVGLGTASSATITAGEDAKLKVFYRPVRYALP